MTMPPAVTRLMARDNATRKDFQLDEVLSLVTLANLHVQWRQDANTAVTLLRFADDTLRDIADPRFTDLRQRIAKQIAALSETPTVDKIGLLSRLSAVQSRAVNFPLQGDQQPKVMSATSSQTASTHEPSDHTSRWRQALQTSWAGISRVLVIRRRETPLQPMLAPSERRLLNQQMQLVLQQAQWAVIQAEPAVFTHSLQRANELLKMHYDSETAVVKTTLTELNNLLSVNIAPELPDLTSLQKAVQSAVDNAAKAHSQASTQGPSA